MEQHNPGSGNKNYQIGNIETAIFQADDRRVDLSDWRPRIGEIERTVQLEQLAAWQGEAQERWGAIVGPGGAGKSVLASQWFERAPVEAKLWTDLQAGPGFGVVARRALQQLGGWPAEQAERLDEEELPGRVAAVLRERRVLWVLDNLETVMEPPELRAGYGEFWQIWRQSAGAAGWVLFTSRDLPGGAAARRLDLTEGFSDLEGATFLERWGIRGGREELARFCRRVHGYPLALGLAAGFLLMEFGDDPHLSRLPEDFFGIAADHKRDPQATLEKVLRWSYDRLPSELQGWLGRLCTLRVSFAREEWEGELRVLAGRSFLVQETLPGDDPNALRRFAYRWQPIIQEFIQRQQADLAEAHRFAIAYHDARYRDLGQWQTKADIDNYIEKWHQEGELAKLIGDQLLEAASFNNLGIAYDSLGQYQRAIDFHEQHLVIAREIGDRRGEANSLGNLGSVYRSLGQYQRAIDFLDQQLVIARAIGDRAGQANSLTNLGNAYSSMGQYQCAIDFHEQSLAIARQIDARQGEANSLGSLGSAYDFLGQYQCAIDFHEQSLAISRAIGDRQGEAASLGNLGNAYRSLRQYQRAIDFHEQSLAIKRAIGDRSGEAISLGNLGNAYHSLGQYQRAIDFQEQSLTIDREIGDRQGEAISLGNLGSAYFSLGQYQRAIDFQEQYLAIARAIVDRRGQFTSLNNLAVSYHKIGRVTEGFKADYEAQQILQELNLPLEVYPLTNWMKRFVKFAQKGQVQLVLYVLVGLVTFPFALIAIISLLLWRQIATLWRR